MMRRAPKPKAIVWVQCRHDLIQLRPTIEGKAMRWKNFLFNSYEDAIFFCAMQIFSQTLLAVAES
jgi:hypothetical protein